MSTNFDQDTNQKYQQALKAGVEPTAALHAANQYQSRKNVVTLGNQADQNRADAARYGGGTGESGTDTLGGRLKFTLEDPESNANITKLAPLAIGATLAPFSGGTSLAGAAFLTGLGTGGAELARQKLNNEQVDPTKVIEEGGLAGIGTYAGGVLANGASGLIGKAINSTGAGRDLSDSVGGFLNQDAKSGVKQSIDALNKAIGHVPQDSGKVIDITDSLRSLSPKDAQALLESGHLPRALASGDTKNPLSLPDSGAITSPPTTKSSFSQSQLNPGEKPLALSERAGANGDLTGPNTQRVVWNPEAKRVEVINTGFTAPGEGSAPLPDNPSDVNVNHQSQKPQLENPSSPNPALSNQPTAPLENPSTGEVSPASQPSSVPENPVQSPTVNPQEAEPATPPVVEDPVQKENRLQQAGANLRQSVVNPQVKASPFGSAEEARLTDVANNQLGLKGSPSQQYDQLGQKFDELQNQVTDALKDSTATVNKDDLMNSLKSSLDNNFSEVDPKALQTIEDNLGKIANKDGEIKIQDLYEYKKSLSGVLKRAFAKLDSPTAVLTAKEETALNGWKQISSAIGEAEPSVAGANRLQRDIFDLAPGLSKARVGTSSLKIPGTNIGLSKNYVGGVKDATGRILQNAGGGAAILNSGNPLSKLAGAVSGSESAASIQGPQNSSSSVTPDEMMASVGDTTSSSSDSITDPSKNPFANPQFVQYLLLLDQSKTGGKNSSLIQTLAGMAAPKALTAAQQLRHDNLNSAFAALDGAEQTLVNAGGAQGATGFLAKIPFFGQYLNSEGSAYEKTKADVAASLAKAITGGSRVPEEVFNNFMESLPDVTNTPEQAAQKLRNLRTDMLVQAKKFGYQDISDTEGYSLPSSPSAVTF